MRGVVRAGGTPSGGTFHSAMTAFSRVRADASRRTRSAARLEPRPTGRRVRLGGKPHRDGLGYWLLPLPTIDPLVVARSARALARTARTSATATTPASRRCRSPSAASPASASLFAAAQVPPLRKLLLGRIKPGRRARREPSAPRSWFTVRFVGEGGGQRVRDEVSGGDPGYGETAKMLAESALCLALDDNPQTAGQVTTAVAMGDALIARLQRAGIGFEVLES